ncbi:translocator protein, LysE family [Enterobacter cancerogenus ATCC 35316]|nr:translocator protein, LysE family [Enterobacter cancerogenus ATCC 35316]
MSGNHTNANNVFIFISEHVMAFHTWLLFLSTSAGISLFPGPNNLLVLTHGVMHGNRKTLATITGGLMGFVLLIGLCMFGIGALLQASEKWLVILRVAGGLYLVFLGYKLWRSPPMTNEAGTQTSVANLSQMFRQGFLSAATNPKALLFFTAVIPPFISPERSLVLQFVSIALTYAFTEFCAEYACATAAYRIRPWLARTGRRFNQVCGGVFMAVGAAMQIRL